jgi:hypothetical protein
MPPWRRRGFTSARWSTVTSILRTRATFDEPSLALQSRPRPSRGCISWRPMVPPAPVGHCFGTRNEQYLSRGRVSRYRRGRHRISRIRRRADRRGPSQRSSRPKVRQRMVL